MHMTLEFYPHLCWENHLCKLWTIPDQSQLTVINRPKFYQRSLFIIYYSSSIYIVSNLIKKIYNIAFHRSNTIFYYCLQQYFEKHCIKSFVTDVCVFKASDVYVLETTTLICHYWDTWQIAVTLVAHASVKLYTWYIYSSKLLLHSWFVQFYFKYGRSATDIITFA